MKSLMIIMGVLAVTMVTYGYNAERFQKFTQDYIKCNEEIGGSLTEHRVEKIQCAMIKDGEVLNDNGEYIKGKALERLGDLISDTGKLEQSRVLLADCYDDAVTSGATGEDQTIKIITCSLEAVSNIEMPQ